MVYYTEQQGFSYISIQCLSDLLPQIDFFVSVLSDKAQDMKTVMTAALFCGSNINVQIFSTRHVQSERKDKKKCSAFTVGYRISYLIWEQLERTLALHMQTRAPIQYFCDNGFILKGDYKFCSRHWKWDNIMPITCIIEQSKGRLTDTFELLDE